MSQNLVKRVVYQIQKKNTQTIDYRVFLQRISLTIQTTLQFKQLPVSFPIQVAYCDKEVVRYYFIKMNFRYLKII